LKHDGIDVVGRFTPKSFASCTSWGLLIISLKGAEAVALNKVKKENVVDLIQTHIIYQYHVPRYIITNNGLAEAFSKTLCNLLKKMVLKSKRDWHEKLGEVL